MSVRPAIITRALDIVIEIYTLVEHKYRIETLILAHGPQVHVHTGAISAFEALQNVGVKIYLQYVTPMSEF